MATALEQFYRQHLPGAFLEDATLNADCPLCRKKAGGSGGKITVVVGKNSLFYGYFRCSSGCVAGGFHHWFARLAGIDPASVPGGHEEYAVENIDYPEKNINAGIDDFCAKRDNEELSYFREANIGSGVLNRFTIGYNGRYLVYPYFQEDGNCYSARCVHPEKEDDYFWYGDEAFGPGPTGLFNVEEIRRCAGGTLFLCEGEANLLLVQQLGFPGVAYYHRAIIEKIDPLLFSTVKTLFIVAENSAESMASARRAASLIGYKVRILRWDSRRPRNASLRTLSADTGRKFAKRFAEMLTGAKPFSPFATPEREWRQFVETLSDSGSAEYSALLSGFPLLDERLHGIHGINILGGGPKVGKSCFMIQIATEMASRRVPVLYYDFENGRQRIYQRTLSRMARLETTRLADGTLSGEAKERLAGAEERFANMLRYFRVVNDRGLTPELMRRHIDFLRHETRSQYSVVVIDSLHKLPFKDLSEMRTGIDAWLRQLETIRDELQVSFLVISELARGSGGSYDEQPHMGIFKGSGDIEYSADNAMVLLPLWDQMEKEMTSRQNTLWLVGSREHNPGLVGRYVLDYPFWGFAEEDPGTE